MAQDSILPVHEEPGSLTTIGTQSTCVDTPTPGEIPVGDYGMADRASFIGKVKRYWWNRRNSAATSADEKPPGEQDEEGVIDAQEIDCVDDASANIGNRSLDKFTNGYPKLATFLDSDDNFMLFRRFGYVSTRVLLQRQDELRVLEEQLETLDYDDFFDHPDRLQKRELQGEVRERLLNDIEAKFCQYATVLGAAQKLMGFNRPTRTDHRSATNYVWNNNPVDPKETSFLECKEDLVSLQAGREHAWLDTMIEKALKTFHCPPIEWVFCSKESRHISSDSDNVYYCKHRIAGLALSIVVLMILFVLVVPTYLLFHLVNEAEDGELSANENSMCIGILLIFTLIFSAILSLFTSARRHEILASAAAYCAILVVFLGNVGIR